MFFTFQNMVRFFRYKKYYLKGICAFLALLMHMSDAFAEPWLDTKDSALRSDIERLSSAGIIKVPINTRPLMWIGILNDLEASNSKDVPKNLKNSYARVLSASKKATRINKPSQSIRFSAASESQLFRHFGDDAREEVEISLQRKGITDNFTYNLQVTKTHNPWDGESLHYDNSYIGGIMGNWVGLVGNLEKWWGPAWNSSLILTNNARPTTGLALQRNFPKAFETRWLEWMGPWTTNIFISELDDERFIDNAKLVGMSIGFRPTQALEINLRRTAQWGGDGRPESLANFLKLLSGVADNCVELSCREEEPGNQLGGIDIRWNLPWLESSIYAQVIGEDEAGGLPSRQAAQLGMQFHFSSEVYEGTIFIEYDDTSLRSAETRYNRFYNHRIYRTGYRYEGRPIGATWDNDSQITSLGAVGYLANGDKLEMRYSYGDLNTDSLVEDPKSRHSITSKRASLSTVSAKWQRPFFWGDIEFEGRYTDSLIDQFGRQENKLRLAASVNYYFY